MEQDVNGIDKNVDADVLSNPLLAFSIFDML